MSATTLIIWRLERRTDVRDLHTCVDHDGQAYEQGRGSDGAREMRDARGADEGNDGNRSCLYSHSLGVQGWS